MMKRTRSNNRIATPPAPGELIQARVALLKVLVTADEKAKKDSDRWVRVDAPVVGVLRPLWTARSLEKLRLVEVSKYRNQVVCKVTQDGLWAYRNNRLSYSALKQNVHVPQPIVRQLLEIAGELGLTKERGKGAGEEPSIGGILKLIIGRPEEFKRWVKAMYPEVGK